MQKPTNNRAFPSHVIVREEYSTVTSQFLHSDPIRILGGNLWLDQTECSKRQAAEQQPAG